MDFKLRLTESIYSNATMPTSQDASAKSGQEEFNAPQGYRGRVGIYLELERDNTTSLGSQQLRVIMFGR